MYTAEEVEYLTETYSNAQDKQAVIDELAEKLNKSRRSIIGKLSRLEIYERKVYLTKRGENPITKQEIVHNISRKMGVDLEKLEGLDKAPKEVLKLIEARF
jgi:Mn-dependent DtxR family transcriptional regulator